MPLAMMTMKTQVHGFPISDLWIFYGYGVPLYWSLGRCGAPLKNSIVELGNGIPTLLDSLSIKSDFSQLKIAGKRSQKAIKASLETQI